MTVSFQTIQGTCLDKVLNGTLVHSFNIPLNKVLHGKVLAVFFSLCNNSLNNRTTYALDCGKRIEDRAS